MILREIKNMYVSKFQQIEYLESTGTQYIDTGVVSQNNLVYDFELVETQENNQKTFFGFKESDTPDAWWSVPGMNDVNWGSRDNDGYWLYVDFANTETRLNLGYPSRNGKYHFDFTDGNAVFTNNGVVMWSSNDVGSYTGSRHVFIFWMDSQFQYPTTDIYDRKGIGRIYYFQIRKNGELLFDGIPVRVGSVGYLYDRVSKRLFGNKGTGNFVLGQDVNSKLQQIYQNKLIEGVDYETYDWLKANIPITTTMMQLPINSRIFEFKRNFIRLMNSDYFNTSNDSENPAYNYFITDYSGGGTGNRCPRIWDISNSSIVYASPTSVNFGVIHTIVANSDEIMIKDGTHTVSLPWYGNPFKINFNNTNNENKNTVHLTSSIKVDGVTRYVPCQLLKPIPRNFDANNIARVAGECGMVDLLAGKFYGNVDNNGTLTVVNDYDGWLKNCSILFDPATAAGYPNYYPPSYDFYGRVEVAKLTPEFVDFGFVQMSNTQVKVGNSVFNADFGTDKWATFIVRYSKGNNLNVEVNGVDLGSPSYHTNYSWAPHIYLYNIMQINKIQTLFHPVQSSSGTTFEESYIPRQDIDRDDNKQYLTNESDKTVRIYAD